MIYSWLDEGTAVLLLLPESQIGEWRGVESNDYERACSVADDWIAGLSVGEGIAFVLGGDPGMALVNEENGRISIIRWVYAEDEEELIEFVREGRSVVDREPEIRFDNAIPKWRLIDAANEGDEESSFRVVPMPMGRVRISTEFLRDERNAAIVHRIFGQS